MTLQRLHLLLVTADGGVQEAVESLLEGSAHLGGPLRVAPSVDAALGAGHAGRGEPFVRLAGPDLAPGDVRRLAEGDRAGGEVAPDAPPVVALTDGSEEARQAALAAGALAAIPTGGLDVTLLERAVLGAVGAAPRAARLERALEELRTARAQVRVVQEVAAVTYRAASVEEGIRGTLRVLVPYLGWDAGHAWLRDGDVLRPTRVWEPAEGGENEPFRALTARTVIGVGEGLVGRVASSDQAEWIEDVRDDPTFLRRGESLGVAAAFALPVRLGSEVVAVLEFFAGNPVPVAPRVLEVARSVGAQLGRVMERERALRAMRETNDLLAQLVEGVPDPLFLKDADGRYLMINRAGARLMGLEPADVVGRTDDEVTYAENARRILGTDREVRKTGRVVTFESHLDDPDGETRTFIVTKGPLRLSDGRPDGIYGIARDLTAVRRAEEALRSREAELRERVKELGTLLLATEVLANWTLPLDERLQQLVDLMPAGWQYPATTEARLVLEDGEYRTEGFRETSWSLRCDVTAGRADMGFLEVCYTEEAPFLDEERVLLDSLATSVGQAVARDRLAEQFLQAQKLEAVGRLAGGIAHDFNNLLTGVQGHVALLRDGLPADDALQEDVAGIQVAVERAGGLTAQLISFSRRSSFDVRVIDLVEAAGTLRGILDRVIGEDVRVTFELAPDPVRVRMDPSLLDQILLNLCVNSRDAMPDGGSIRVRVGVDELAEPRRVHTGELAAGSWAVVEVEDTGEGMAPDVMAHVFEPFYSTRGPGKGTGLGLSVVYGAVRHAGGEVQVESAVGEGTRFRVYLPLAPASGASPEAGGARRAASDGPGDRPAGRPGTILVVEDETNVRTVLGKILGRAGYDVAVARDGSEALELLESGDVEPDLVLSDIVMPRLGGVELARAMRARGIDVPVLFITGYTEEEIPGSAELPGVLGVVQKPFTPDEILPRIADGLRERRGG